jgi:hypothetical protein
MVEAALAVAQAPLLLRPPLRRRLLLLVLSLLGLSLAATGETAAQTVPSACVRGSRLAAGGEGADVQLQAAERRGGGWGAWQLGGDRGPCAARSSADLLRVFLTPRTH